VIGGFFIDFFLTPKLKMHKFNHHIKKYKKY